MENKCQAEWKDIADMFEDFGIYYELVIHFKPKNLKTYFLHTVFNKCMLFLPKFIFTGKKM